MEDMKRMVDNYEVYQAITIGRVEVLLGVDHTHAEHPYMVCYCDRNNSLGVEQFYEAVAGADYMEAMHSLFPACSGNWGSSKQNGRIPRCR